jgi:DNA-binding NarL/FixJ family response regulator
MTRRSASRPAQLATDREVVVVAAVLVAGSEKAAAHRLGLSHSTVKHHLANARSKVGATGHSPFGEQPGRLAELLVATTR